MQNDISSLFTQVHAIVLPSRKEYVKNTFRKMGITYSEFDCVLGSTLDKSKLINDGIIVSNSNLRINEIACALSHVGVITKFYNTSRNYNDTCMIFEDDITYDPDHFNKLKKCMDNMPSGWEFINFGRCWDNCSSQKKINDYIVVSERSLCTHSYAITRACAKKILDSCFPIPDAIDRFYVNNCKNLFTIYSSSPRIYNQLNSSDNTIIGTSTLGNSDSPECSYSVVKQIHKNKNIMLILLFVVVLVVVVSCFQKNIFKEIKNFFIR